MTKNVVSFIVACGLFFAFRSAQATDFTPGAGGPWLVYKYVGTDDGALFILNLGYDSGPQFSFSEEDPDEDMWLNLTETRNRKGQITKKEIWKQTWDGNNTDNFGLFGGDTKNKWHRLSWGRQGSTFALLYSQYEVIESTGVADHGVFLGSGACVTWPNTVGKGKNRVTRSIGIEGNYPETISISMMRLDGGWDIPSGKTLPGYGSRQVKPGTFRASLDIDTTLALNQRWSNPTTKASVDTNDEAKNWVFTYYRDILGYTPLPDKNDP